MDAVSQPTGATSIVYLPVATDGARSTRPAGRHPGPTRCDDGTDAVADRERSGQVRPVGLARRRAQLHRQRAVRDVDGEDVAVAGAFDVARRHDVARHDRRRRRGVAVIVGAIPDSRRQTVAVGSEVPISDDRQIVLEVVRTRILPTRPLAHRSGRIDRTAHDRRPGAVTVVVAGACRPAIVTQPKRVAGLMGGRFAHRLGGLFVADVGEHVRRMVGVRAEHVQQRDADHAGAREVRRGHHHALAVRRIDGRGPAETFQARIAGGDVDVEGPVVLRNALPHLVDQRLFRGGEGAGNAVDVERCRSDDRLAHAGPRRVLGVMAVEIEVEDAARCRT